MQIVSNRDNLHEISNPILWKKKSVCRLLTEPREWWQLLVEKVLYICIYVQSFV